MKLLTAGLLMTVFTLSGCFWRTEKSPAPVVPSLPTPRPSISSRPAATATPAKDRSLEVFVKYFEQADAIHREAWWVLTSQRRPVQKSPFGKVVRSILSSQDIKLANKSAFSCDRYIFKRDVLGAQGFPQKAEVFEKCSDKTAAKKIADFFAPSLRHIDATFYPENLEEILGLGATVLNRSIKCTLKGNESEQLESLKCVDWAQDRTKEQMIRLDDYEYTRTGKNLIKLRGKVYENLSDTRKIEADIPMEGKILVKETELYPPEATPTPAPVVKGNPGKVPGAAATSMPKTPMQVVPVDGEGSQINPGVSTLPGLPPPRTGGGVPVVPVDPDVLMQQHQQQQQQQQGPTPSGPEMPVMENGQPVPPSMPVEGGEPAPLSEEQQQLQYQQQMINQGYPTDEPPPAALPAPPPGGQHGR